MMMTAGITVALGWRMLDLDERVYEGLPGMAAAFAVWGFAKVARMGRSRHS